MKILFLFSSLFFLASCSKSYLYTNHTGKEIQTIVLLNEKDTENFELSYDELQSRNILVKPLVKQAKFSLNLSKKTAPYCIYFEDTDYQSYFYYQPDLENINFSAEQLLNYKTVDYLADSPGSVRIKVDNQSDYYIRYIIIESNGFPETYQTLNAWNIVDKRKKAELVYNGFEQANDIVSISLVGFKNGRKLTIQFTENLDDYLVFAAE